MTGMSAYDEVNFYPNRNSFQLRCSVTNNIQMVSSSTEKFCILCGYAVDAIKHI